MVNEWFSIIFPANIQDDDKPKLKCEFCGKVDYAYKFRRSKRFCTMACSKRYNVGCSRRLGLFKPATPSQGGHNYQKKRKEQSNKKGWKRGQGGRVSTGPIVRVSLKHPDFRV